MSRDLSIGQKFNHSKQQKQSKYQRLSTQQMIPNFRRNYQIVELHQEISKLNLALQIKQKQIHYLSTQTVSVKQELTSQIISLEKIVSDQKKQLTQLRYSALKDKRSQNQKHDELIKDIKGRHEVEIMEIKKGYENRLKNQNIQKHKQIENMEDKIRGLLEIEKRDRQSLQKIYRDKQKSWQKQIIQYKNQVQKQQKQKLEYYQQIRQYEKALQKIKNQMKSHEDNQFERQKKFTIELQALKQDKKQLYKQSINLKLAIKSIKQDYSQQSEIHQSQILQKNQYIKQLGKIIEEKDRLYSQMAKKNINSAISQKQTKKIDLIHNCNHQELINKLQTNIKYKEKQNIELKQQLKKWGKYIGFQETLNDRTASILNASSDALQTQSYFKNSLKRLSKGL